MTHGNGSSQKGKILLSWLLALALTVGCVGRLMPIPAQAASSSEIRKQINAMKKDQQEIQKKIKDVESQYQKNEDEIADIISKKNVIDQQIALLSDEIRNISGQITSFNTLIADKQDELETAQGRYDALCQDNKERIQSMEESGTISYWEVIFQAKSFTDLLDRLNMVEEIAAADRKRMAELSQAAENVEEAKVSLEGEKEELESTKQEMDQAEAQLDDKRAEADQLIQELLEKADDLDALKAEFSRQEEDFMTEIAQMEKEYTKAKAAEWAAYMATATTATTAPPAASGGTTSGGSSSGGSSGSTSSGTSAPTTGGSWQRPCSYTYVSSAFGNRESPTAGASTYHQGIDLAAPMNTPVYAARSGVVTVATFGSAAGNYVSINHMDGYASIYMHLNSYVVSSGQSVSAGQLIGYVGKTGVATGYHLHFGISYSGVYVNPAAYIAF